MAVSKSDDTTENGILHPSKNSVNACVIFFSSSSNKVSIKDSKLVFFFFQDDVLTNKEVEIDEVTPEAEVEGDLIEVKARVEDLIEIFSEDRGVERDDDGTEESMFEKRDCSACSHCKGMIKSAESSCDDSKSRSKVGILLIT